MKSDNQNRRKILKGLIAGGGVAGAGSVTEWSRPIVESVTLPAHAATSVAGGPQRDRFSLLVNALLLAKDINQDSERQLVESASPSIADLFISSAHAQTQVSSTSQLVLIERPGSTYDFYALDSFNPFEDCIIETLATAGGLTVGGGSVPLSYSDCTGGIPGMGGVELIAVSDTDASVELLGSSPFTLNLDPSAGPLSVATPCSDCLDDT